MTGVVTKSTMTKDDNRRFLDTNILLTACDADRVQHRDCRELIESALRGKSVLYASGQVFREYLVVSTRPKKNNGLGMQPKSALENVAAFRQCVQVLAETSGVADRLASLVGRYRLKGKRIHDANIVATMLENGLTKLITLNPGDFSSIKEVEVSGL